ncbi:thioredoxin family protein [Methylotenera mobilis]|uniref:Thioredoxin domain protein n=1 Tax=Methylotenera mobilis (strain JLW8 / ATCC BAA-1282 / DSM 17540) TaxID=583345 RepID=C6WYQ0_METML|nr:thioredoxin family protein [Methylotenera mobilis]ACT47025.1 Thioredoxin domain protein [Methylotenera mobilis JLW8]
MKFIMKSILRNILMLSVLFAGSAMADTVAFTQAAFAKLQLEGKPILVHIHANWCPTCRAQAPIISSLLKQKYFQTVTSLRVDFDQQKDIVKAFHASRQSTLIVFKGNKELGRSLGDTTPDGIEKLLRKTL